MNIKHLSRRLQEALPQVTGHTISHMHSLEVTSRLQGYRNWHEAQRHSAGPFEQIPAPPAEVHVNPHLDQINSWSGVELQVLYALADRADSSGIARIGAIELGELASPDTTLSSHQAYARGWGWINMTGRTGMYDADSVYFADNPERHRPCQLHVRRGVSLLLCGPALRVASARTGRALQPIQSESV
ncbi:MULTISPECIES: hypothetical protein [unclassified Deinococcus]|uniref:hypothetical protein n=1 Tax=unclassified Deinococcus TaxID=2623546 RepID=UPI001E2F61D7|nr:MULTISPECIES: hypothetical protein [unclassified Deinococcus]MCD0155872.1 hypothetical protein [Deinococcus sp. 6GRE01]MCD0160288.1 hypothetical protein [Deinococcus sp. 6YEL10]